MMTLFLSVIVSIIDMLHDKEGASADFILLYHNKYKATDTVMLA